MACESASGMPSAAPVSRPSERDSMKYAPPPFMRMFVASAEMESPVRKVMELPMTTSSRERARPTCPSIQPTRRYITTPMMVRMLGVNTPWNVPNPYPPADVSFFMPRPQGRQPCQAAKRASARRRYFAPDPPLTKGSIEMPPRAANLPITSMYFGFSSFTRSL